MPLTRYAARRPREARAEEVDLTASKPRFLLMKVHNQRRIQFNLSGINPMLPLGIALLGAQLERAGAPVELLDLSLPEHRRIDLARHVAEGGYQVVGLSATLFSLPETCEHATAIKARAPETMIVVGGRATVFSPEALFRHLPAVDAFAFGEGEQVILDLAAMVERGEHAAAIPGVAFRVNGEVRFTPPAPPLDMDTLPLPARHLLPRDRYGMHPPFNRFPPITLIESARGCPYSCAFCMLPRIYRCRSVEHVLTEVRQVVRDEGVRELHFVDPTFTADRERTLRLAAALAPLGLRFTCKSRLDCVDDELLAALRRAGCYLISIGVETFEAGVMTYLNKEMDAATVPARLRQVKTHGLEVLAYMLLGTPGETTDGVVRAVRGLLRAGVDFALFSDLFPDPETELTRRAMQQGHLSAADVEAYYFHRTPLPDRGSLAGLPLRQLKRWVLMSFLMFYLSPRTLVRLLRKASTWRQFRRSAAAGLQLLTDMFWKRRIYER